MKPNITTQAEGGTILAPTAAGASIKSAIATARRRARLHLDQARRVEKTLIQTGDMILDAVRTMTDDERRQTYEQAIKEKLITNRRELRDPVSVLAEIALGETLSPSSLSQFRSVLRRAADEEVSVASLAGEGTIWSAYKNMIQPRTPISPLYRISMDLDFAVRAAADGVLLQIKATSAGGYELVECQGVNIGRPGALVIEGTAEAVTQLDMFGPAASDRQPV